MRRSAILSVDPTCDGSSGSLSRVTDDELVQRARAGSSHAFDALVVRHQAAVYRAARAALRVPEDAEEVAQVTVELTATILK
jgi:hypothetical protein